VATISINNASSNDTTIEYLKSKPRDKMVTILNNEFMPMRCRTHILYLIVTEDLKKVNDSIMKVRNTI
jgi:hypothetical protein